MEGRMIKKDGREGAREGGREVVILHTVSGLTESGTRLPLPLPQAPNRG